MTKMKIIFWLSLAAGCILGWWLGWWLGGHLTLGWH